MESDGEMLTFLVLIGSFSITVASSCSHQTTNTYTCIDIASDSVCTDYRSNRLYLNYTNDIDMLFLESDVIDYIESNVSSELCRDYLMVAVCNTIYPVCTENDTVKQLCSEDCALNEGMCTQESADVITYINEWMGDPVINFTLNCSNSLNFAELYLESSVCYDNDCLPISMVNGSDNYTGSGSSMPTSTPTTAAMPTTPIPIPDTCMQVNSFEDSACEDFFRGSDNIMFKYTTLEGFESYIETVNNLESLLVSADTVQVCRQAAAYFICNYVFIPCNLTTGNPRPICTIACDYYFNDFCKSLFEVILRFSSILEYPFMNNCPNTLSHLDTFGFSLSSDSFADDCIDIVAIVEPDFMIPDGGGEPGGGDGMSSEDDSSNNSSGVVIGVSVVGSFLVLGVVAFLVVLCLLIRHKHKASSYNASLMCPVTFHNHNGVVMVEKAGSSEGPNEQVADGHTALTTEDLKLLKKEFGDDFTDLLLPGYQVMLTEVLGEGEFGRVFKGIWTHQSSTGEEISEEVAVKTIKNYNSLEKLKSFLRESAVMKDFFHPNVLQVLGISLETEDGLPYIVLPFMANGDLKTFLKSKRPDALVVDQFPEDLGENRLVTMCYQIACGMNYLAGKKIVHRDLAARNCMVDDKINIRVADFGLARDVHASDYYRQQSTGKIPIKWMAPETLNDRISNEKTDVWSYGITCWEIFSLGRTPYPTIPNHEIPEYVEAGNRPAKPQLCPVSMYSVMSKCWEVDTKSRYCFSEIVAELSKLTSCDDGYYVLESSGAHKNNGYIIPNPTMTRDDHSINPTVTPDVDFMTTPDEQYVNPTVSSDADLMTTVEDDDHYVNPTVTSHSDVMTPDDNPNVTVDADFTAPPDDHYVNSTVIHDT